MSQLLSAWLSRFRPEDPRRIQAFRTKLEGLSWDAQSAAGSLSALFAAVDDLAEAEVQYYYRRRGTRAWVSGVTRVGAWLLGTVGLLLPLLAGTAAAMFQGWGSMAMCFLLRQRVVLQPTPCSVARRGISALFRCSLNLKG